MMFEKLIRLQKCYKDSHCDARQLLEALYEVARGYKDEKSLVGRLHAEIDGYEVSDALPSYRMVPFTLKGCGNLRGRPFSDMSVPPNVVQIHYEKFATLSAYPCRLKLSELVNFGSQEFVLETLGGCHGPGYDLVSVSVVSDSRDIRQAVEDIRGNLKEELTSFYGRHWLIKFLPSMYGGFRCLLFAIILYSTYPLILLLGFWFGIDTSMVRVQCLDDMTPNFVFAKIGDLRKPVGVVRMQDERTNEKIAVAEAWGGKAVVRQKSDVVEKCIDGAASGLVQYTIEEKFPGGRIFTYQYVTNNGDTRVTFIRTRSHAGSKPHDGPDRWGVISNTYAFSDCVNNLRSEYAHGRYTEALRLAAEATNILGRIITQSDYTNYILDWGLICDTTFLSEIFAEQAISEGRYLDAKSIIKWNIGEHPIAPTRSAAIYFAADILSGEKTWLFSQHVTLNISNGVSKILRKDDTSYVQWDERFEFDAKAVNRQLALWGYVYPLLSVDGGEDFVEMKYSELLGLPDNLPYPRLKKRWIMFGDYYGERWKGFGRYESYNVSEMLRKNDIDSIRLRRDGVTK